MLAALHCALLQAQDSRERLLADANAAYHSLHSVQAVSLYRDYLARYPDRADVRVYLGGALLNLDQLQPALEEANRAIALDHRYAKGYILAGRVYSAREQWDVAQGLFEKAQRLDPRDLDAWYFSGRALYVANRFEPAVAAFEQALRAGAEQSRVYENLALSQDALGRYDAAEKSFRRAVDLANGASRPYLAYGAFLFRQGRASESLPLLQRTLGLAPDDVDVRFELGRVLYHQNSLAEAARVLGPALPSNECRIHNLFIRIYSARGESGQAAAEVKAMENCKAGPEHP
jgi:tetratricopeptide (TPR) repeat protein